MSAKISPTIVLIEFLVFSKLLIDFFNFPTKLMKKQVARFLKRFGIDPLKVIIKNSYFQTKKMLKASEEKITPKNSMKKGKKNLGI